MFWFASIEAVGTTYRSFSARSIVLLSPFVKYITKEKKLVITFPSAKLIIQGEHDLCTFPLLHTVAIPATIENTTRLKCRNYVLLSTEGCRDQTAPFSFSLLFPFIILDSVFKEQGDPTSKGTFLFCIILHKAHNVNIYHHIKSQNTVY